jgi:hypothetical protein
LEGIEQRDYFDGAGRIAAVEALDHSRAALEAHRQHESPIKRKRQRR